MTSVPLSWAFSHSPYLDLGLAPLIIFRPGWNPTITHGCQSGSRRHTDSGPRSPRGKQYIGGSWAKSLSFFPRGPMGRSEAHLPLYWFPVGAVTNCHRWSDLKQQELTLPLFWRSSVLNQGAVPPLKPLGEKSSLPLPASGGPRHSSAVAASLQSLPLSWRGLFSVCLSTLSSSFS